MTSWWETKFVRNQFSEIDTSWLKKKNASNKKSRILRKVVKDVIFCISKIVRCWRVNLKAWDNKQSFLFIFGLKIFATIETYIVKKWIWIKCLIKYSILTDCAKWTRLAKCYDMFAVKNWNKYIKNLTDPLKRFTNFTWKRENIERDWKRL